MATGDGRRATDRRPRATGRRQAGLAWLSVVACLVPVGATAQPGTVAAVVAQFYPASLDADVAAIAAGNGNVRHQCWAVLQADASGDPLVVLAAYTNSQSGSVRVLARGAAGFAVADEAAGAPIAGSSCRAEAIDVDADGTLEAVVKFGARAGTNDWVYAWRDGALADLSPLTADGVPIAVVNSEFVDLDGDGVLELRSKPSPPGASAKAPVSVFRLSAGSYVPNP
jgi:hypothetical protein